MISLQKAKQIVWDIAKVLPVEKIELLSCHEKVLAEDIEASFDYPPFNRSAMDGYALKFEDTLTATTKKPILLHIAGEIQAGISKKFYLVSGECYSVFTGNILPYGADAVVKFEDVKILNKGKDCYIKIFKPVRKNENISFRGEDIHKGAVVIKKGTVIDAAVMMMLAYLGKSKIKVRQQPQVSIIATGDELVEPGKRLSGSKIYNSNTYGLYALVKENKVLPVIFGIARDKEESLTPLLKRALNYDIVIISGGVSEGKFDLVVKILKKLEVKEIFWKVAVKPGKPVFFGTKENTLVFGLPGYPVSTYLSFYNFVKTAMEKMLGYKKPCAQYIYGELLSDINNSSNRTSLFRVSIVRKNGKNLVMPYHKQKSGMLNSIICTNGLLIVEKGKIIKKGTIVRVEIIRSNFL